MIHARKDYDRIQDPAGLIGEDEPVFLIRGKDMNGPVILAMYAVVAQLNDASDEMFETVMAPARRMRDWQRANGRKVPDMPVGAGRL